MSSTWVLFVCIISLTVAEESSEQVNKRSLEHEVLPNYAAAYPGPYAPTQLLGRLVEIENTVAIPHPVAVPHPIPIPVPVPVSHPVPITVPVGVPQVKTVPIPIPKPVPYPVVKSVPIEIVKKIPVGVPQPYPVPVPVYKTKHIYHGVKVKYHGHGW